MAAPDSTRQLLIDVAGPLFARKGLEATSVRDVTEAAGVNPAAIHYHFGGKGSMERLYTEAVRQAAQSCISQGPLPEFPPGTPPAPRLRGFINAFLRRVVIDREPAWHAQLIQREMTDPTPACATFVNDFVRPSCEALRDVLQQFLPRRKERKLLLCAFSIVGQCLHYRFARPVVRLLVGEEGFQTLDIDALTEHIFEFSVAALRGMAGRQRRKEPS